MGIPGLQKCLGRWHLSKTKTTA